MKVDPGQSGKKMLKQYFIYTLWIQQNKLQKRKK